MKEALCREVQIGFGRFLHASFIKKLWEHYLDFASKNEAVCCWVQTHFGSFLLWGLWIKFLAHYHDFCVRKRRCLPWSSDAFWKFSACKVHKKISGRIITIYVSENEVVCSKVQMHFGRSLPTIFAEKVLGAYSRFLHPKMKLFAVKFRHILEVFALQRI